MVILSLRQSFGAVYGRWLLELFWVVVWFPVGRKRLPNFRATFTRMGRKRPYRVVAVFPYDFLARLGSFSISLGLSNRTDLYSNDPVYLGHGQSFCVVCFDSLFASFVSVFKWSFTVIRKIVKTMKDPLRAKTTISKPGSKI